ncbi:MAG TPA: aminopeptidase [Candidatus Binatia bacterium]|nr:aminopeptidase [Candidatus Binatia bacterium]
MRRALLAAALALGLGAGCATPTYLARLGWSEARILWRRRPIPALLGQPDLDPTLRARLELVLAVRAFARDRLGLRVDGSFASFAEVGGDATVWVLSAARRDRLEAVTWWYPIVGRVPYRGFFAPAAAEAAGAALAGRDLDVEVRRALAFSTLGWFADPLLSPTAAEPPVVLADTVIHELFHATLYVPGAAAFDESAATFVGGRGAAAFFCTGPTPDPAACERARARWAAARARARVLGRLAGQLRRLYARTLPRAARERARAWLAGAAADALVARRLGRREELVPPNNARLLGELLYATDLDRFDALAPADADLPEAIRRLVEAARGHREPFAALAALQNHPAALD